MFNSWARSVLRLPEPPILLAFPPSSTTLPFVLVVCKSNAYILNSSQAEPRLECKFTVPDSHEPVQQCGWTCHNRIYLLRSNTTTTNNNNRLDVFEFIPAEEEEGDGQGRAEVWPRSSIMFGQLDSPITCFAALPDENLLLGNANGHVLELSDFTKKTKLVCRCFEGGGGVGLIKVQSHVACAISLETNKLSLFSHPQGQISKLDLTEPVATVAFSQQGSILAIGLQKSPRILLYSLPQQQQDVPPVLIRTLVVFGVSLVEEELALGGVRELCFNGNSQIISCLFQGKSEPTVFHTLSGRRTTTGSGNYRQAKFDSRHLVLGWSGQNHLYYINELQELCRQGFAYHGPQCSLVRNDFTRFALLGEDYCSLLLLDGSPKFTRFDAPADYCSKFGALGVMAIDEGGDKIAVASPRGGFCVFFSQIRKWRRFQSEFLEQQVQVKKMAWLPHSNTLLVVSLDVVPAAAAVATAPAAMARVNQHRIDLYDLSEQRLDAEPVYSMRLAVNALPIAIDFASQNLMFCLFPAGIQVYRYTPHSLRAELFFTKPKSMLGALTHFCLVPSIKLDSVLPRSVVLDARGCCSVLDLESGGDSICLARTGVADVWTKLDPTLGVVVWSLVDAGLKLWVPALDPVGEIYQQEDFDIAFAEVGSLPVGTEEDAFICLQAHSNLVRASKSPVLHGILGWLLRQQRDGLARRVLAERRFSKSSGLVRAALEDLLQGSLLGENKIEVGNVVSVLGCVPFEMMAAVVARCARQIDPELWEVLFSIVGQPRDLFHQCLVRFDANLALGNNNSGSQNSELLLIAAELLPVVDADRNDPVEGPVRRAKQVLVRCEPGGRLQREVKEYAAKRGLELDSVDQVLPPLPEQGVVSAFFASFFT